MQFDSGQGGAAPCPYPMNRSRVMKKVKHTRGHGGVTTWWPRDPVRVTQEREPSPSWVYRRLRVWISNASDYIFASSCVTRRVSDFFLIFTWFEYFIVTFTFMFYLQNLCRQIGHVFSFKPKFFFLRHFHVYFRKIPTVHLRHVHHTPHNHTFEWHWSLELFIPSSPPYYIIFYIILGTLVTQNSKRGCVVTMFLLFTTHCVLSPVVFCGQ